MLKKRDTSRISTKNGMVITSEKATIFKSKTTTKFGKRNQWNDKKLNSSRHEVLGLN